MRPGFYSQKSSTGPKLTEATAGQPQANAQTSAQPLLTPEQW